VEPSNAVLVISFAGGDRIPGLPVLDWRVQGEIG